MTLNRGLALWTHGHPTFLFRGPELDAGGALRSAIVSVRRAACGLGGHEYCMRSGNNRIFLQCMTCGHETPGWQIDVNARPNRITRRAQGCESSTAGSRT